MSSQRRLQQNQSGMVSIMVTIIVMIILSLIVLGFARIVRREQRQSLDSQLSTQAFYAAEAGINEAREILKLNPTAKKPNCGVFGATPGSGFDTLVSDIDAASGIAFTCLIVDPAPPDLRYDTIKTDQSTIIPIKSESGGALNNVTITWQEANKTPPIRSSLCRSDSKFPPAGGWPPTDCNAGILRIDLVPIAGSLNRAGLMDGTLTAFLYPTPPGGSGTLAYGSVIGFGGQGAIVLANCPAVTPADAKLCTVTINDLGQNSYIMRVKSIYKPNSLTITSSAGDLTGAQAIIDSTGKANDVLRRVQVRVPTKNVNDDLFPEYALQSVDTICKQLIVSDTVENGCSNTPTAPPAGVASFVVTGPGGSGSPGSPGSPGLPPCSSLTTVSPQPGVNCRFPLCSNPSVVSPQPGVNCNGAGEGGSGLPPCSSLPTGSQQPGVNCKFPLCSNPSVVSPQPGVNCNGGGGPGSPGSPGGQPYTRRFTNRAENNDVASCTWDWGDGSPAGTTACLYNQTIDHTFPSTPATACYFVKLTIYFNNGNPPAIVSDWVRVPTGGSTAPCP